MPDELDGVARADSSADARHVDEGATFGVEALRASDVVPGLQAVGRADLLEMGVDPRPCSPPSPLCVLGDPGDGGAVAVWASADGTLVDAALADTQQRLELLLEAWQQAAFTAAS